MAMDTVKELKMPIPPRFKKKLGRPKKDPGYLVDKFLAEISIPAIDLTTLEHQPKTCGLREHPYILFLAEKWEQIEGVVDKCKAEQQELMKAAGAFRNSYQQKET